MLALRGQLAEKEAALDALRATLSAARRSLGARAGAAELALAEREAQAAGTAEQQGGALADAETVRTHEVYKRPLSAQKRMLLASAEHADRSLADAEVVQLRGVKRRACPGAGD